jgi:regulator of replication initiation timing
MIVGENRREFYMYDYDFEEYYEPTIADEIMNEASAKLKEALKQTSKENYEQIIAENKKLKAENAELQKFVGEIDDIKYQLRREQTEIESKVRRQRLSEVMKDFEVELYRPKYDFILLPKCNKCDENRKIKFLSPSGKEHFETCSCHKKERNNYCVESYYCSEFNGGNDVWNKRIRAWYKVIKKGTDDEYYSYESSTYLKTLIQEDFTDFESLENKNETFFRSKETCQAYCDYLNKAK